MNRQGKLICVLTLSFSLAALLASCTTKSQARMDAQQAYLEGQNAALKQQQASGAGVTVIGAVQTSFVPWVAGLTLAQAIATANYIGANEPKQIIITRQGESATLDAKVLLDGTEIPLETGDVIELR
jgi:hypothetical protein